MTGTNHDIIIPFTLAEGKVRGRYISIDGVLDQIYSAHNYPSIIMEIIAQLAIVASFWGSSFKTDGIISCEITSTEGIVKKIIVDYSSEGNIRGYCSYDIELFSRYLAPTYEDLIRNGMLVVTVDSSAADRYQSIIALNAGGSLLDSLREYFAKSEQIKVLLEVVMIQKNKKNSIRALMLQYLPGIIEVDNLDFQDDWHRYELFLGSIKLEEFLLPPHELLYSLFHLDNPMIYNSTNITYKCRCSREKMAKALSMLSTNERQSLKTEHGTVIRCQFCGHTEEFE